MSPFFSPAPLLFPPTLAEAHAALAELAREVAGLRELARVPLLNPNPAFRLLADGRAVPVNPAAERLKGQLGTEVADQMRVLARTWLPDALASGRELRYDVAAGEQHFAVCIVPDPAQGDALLYLTDMTARVQAESQRAAQQAFTEQVLDALPGMVYVRDAHGRYVYQNRATRLMSEQLALGSPPSAVAAAQAAQLAACNADVTRVLASGQAHSGEETMTLPSGEVRVVHTVKQPLVWGSGEAHVLGVSTDITDLKQAQHAAEAAATARANFLANMSHEIRTPLNGVLGITAQLAKTSLDARQQELLRIVQGSGRHLLGVINDVLDMAKITSGKLELVHEPFDVCEMLFQAAQPLFVQAQEKGIDVEAIRLNESCPNPQVVGDPHRISQVALNLFSNAIKFTPAGGKITAGGYQVAQTPDTLTIEFRFTDTGVGIAPDKLERIFESFAQAYADTARTFGGTGLGLSISRALVERMGGTLTVESTLGQGSTFAFQLTLPRGAALEPAPAGPVAEAGRHALRGRRVLLVEDNEINRLVAGLLLEEWGIVYDEAEDGPTAIARAAARPYDAVLMDIQMPGMSGLEATAAIRALPDPVRAAVPIVALTANAFEADRQQCLAAGMQACVAKPFDEALLYHTLTELVAER